MNNENEHDPFNEPERAHARARELMSEPFFWDCTNEWAPFGSDEGWDAYYEFRRWREENPASNLKECMAWIPAGELDGYSDTLCSDESIARDLAKPDEAFLAEHFDMFTLDATVIATALGQLLDEGTIDAEAKPYVYVALKRQLHPQVTPGGERQEILLATKRVVDAA